MSSGLPDYTENTQIYGAVTISGTVTISGAVTVTNTVTVTGSVSITGTVTVSGTVSISGTVTVSGTVSISGTVTVSGAVTVSGTVSISGTVTVSGTVSISGTVTVSGSVTVSGTVSISGTVTVSGTVVISGTVTVSGSVSVTGTVAISGTVTISGSVSVTGTVTISGNVTISNATLNVDVITNVLSTGQAKAAIGFNGASSFISVLTSTDLNPTSEDFTLIIKLRAKAWSTAPGLWCRGVYNTDGIRVYVNSSGLITVEFNQAAAHQNQSSSSAISLFTDTIIHITRTGVTCAIYFNGSDVTGTHYDITNPVTNTRALYIGSNESGSAAFYDGSLYSVRFHKGLCMTAAQVTEDYANPNNPDTNSLKLWLKLEEGSGTGVRDSSGNTHDGTLTSCIWLCEKGGVSPFSLNISQPAPITSQQNAELDPVSLAAGASMAERLAITGRGKVEYLVIYCYTGASEETDIKLSIKVDGHVVLFGDDGAVGLTLSGINTYWPSTVLGHAIWWSIYDTTNDIYILNIKLDIEFTDRFAVWAQNTSATTAHTLTVPQLLYNKMA